MKKYNLIINDSFKKLGFSDKIDDSIYATCNANLLQFSVILTLEAKPSDNTTATTINKGSNINCYIFPLSNKNSVFNIGDLLYTHDNKAVFIVISHIIDNKFVLKLINVNVGTSYQLFNTTPAILHNTYYEQFMHTNNDLVSFVRNQKSEYTKYINNNNDFIKYFLEKILITESDSTIGMSFDFTTTESPLFSNIIDKFYLNMWVFDYNDFKYIYSTDIKSGENKSNEELVSNNRILGVLKSLQTKIIPHYTTQLIKNNTFSFSTDIVNKYTKFSKTYNKNKLILIFQLSLKNKAVVYDQDDNVDSDYMYLIQ